MLKMQEKSEHEDNKFFESVADLKYLGKKVNLYLCMPSRH